MKNFKMELNDKGVICLILLILCLTFGLGYLSSARNKENQNATVFTRDELERILELQKIEDENGLGAEICASKDKNGNLSITWQFEKLK